MKIESFILLCSLLGLVLVVSSTGQIEETKGEKMVSLLFKNLLFLLLIMSNGVLMEVANKPPEPYHVNNEYGGGGSGWVGYGGDGWGGSGGGGNWGGYGGVGWGGYGGGGWGGQGGGYVGWGGPGGGGGWAGGGWGGGCRFGCCGYWNYHRGCGRCCHSLTEAITFNEHEASP